MAHHVTSAKPGGQRADLYGFRKSLRVGSAAPSLVNQTVFCERACARERGRGGREKYGLAKLARFSWQGRIQSENGGGAQL